MRQKMEKMILYGKGLGKWLFLSAAVGVLCGFAGALFHIGVDKANVFRERYPVFLLLLPIIGVGICFLYDLWKVEGIGTNHVLEAIHSGKELPAGLFPAIFLSTVLTHLGGGSAGREGAALQMGGTIGSVLGRLAKLDDRDRRTVTMTGMAAFFSALFGTPVAASVFAMAVVSVGLLYHAALFPCLVASLCAYGISLALGVEPTRLTLKVPAIDAPLLLQTALLAALCALVSILFCETVHITEKLFSRYLKNRWVRALVGGILVAGLTLLIRAVGSASPGGGLRLALGDWDYNSAGMPIIKRAVEAGEAVPAAFLLKILFTAITLAAGFKGGEVVPALFVGATFGCVAGPFLGLEASFGAAIGMMAVFCGAVNCPLATIFLSVEIFGSQALLPFALACSVSYILSGYHGLYSSQRILYDKLKAQYINVFTNSYHEKKL